MIKNLVLISFLLILVSCKKKDLDSKIKTHYVSSITNGEDTWNFDYNSQNQLEKVLFSNPYGTSSVSFTYDLDGKLRESNGKKYEYDSEGRMIAVYAKEMVNDQEVWVKTQVLTHTDEYIKVTAPDAIDIAGFAFYLENGNVTEIACHNCAPVPDFGYADVPSIFPQELRRYWNIVGTRIPLFNFHDIGSDDFLNYYYSFNYGLLPSNFRNEFTEINENGLPTKIEVKVAEGLFIPKGKELGEVIETYFLDYELR